MFHFCEYNVCPHAGPINCKWTQRCLAITTRQSDNSIVIHIVLNPIVAIRDYLNRPPPRLDTSNPNRKNVHCCYDRVGPATATGTLASRSTGVHIIINL